VLRLQQTHKMLHHQKEKTKMAHKLQ